MRALISGVMTISLPMLLAACGGSNGGANFTIGGGSAAANTGTASFAISDAPVDDVKQVVIEVDRIILKKQGESDVVIDRFTSVDLGLVDVDSFQIDLLDYQGSRQAVVIEDLELLAGDYSDIRLEILDEDINQSYVVEMDDDVREIKVPSNELKLGGFTVQADGVQTFTIDFNLRHAMTYRTGPMDYILKPRGVYLLDNASASILSGEIDSSLFDTVTPCVSKVDPTIGNILYLYSGHGLDRNELADVFDSDDSVSTIPASAIEPYSAVAPVQQAGGEWTYQFGFLPAGDYTLVFSCNALGDDPDNYDGITLPLPDDQLIELTLGEGVDISCDLPVSGTACKR